MSTISANAAGGNASSTSTWAGGVVPGPADDLIVPATAAVTVDAPLSVRSVTVNSTSGTAFGVLTVNSALNLTLASGAGVLLNSSYNQSACPALLVIGPGGSVTVNPTAGNTVAVQVGSAAACGCGWSANGTGWGAGQSCALTNAGAGTAQVAAPGFDNGSLTASYLTITGFGSATLDAVQHKASTDPGQRFTADHCRFVGCGALAANVPGPSNAFRLNDVRFTGGLGAADAVITSAGNNVGTVSRCAFGTEFRLSNAVGWTVSGNHVPATTSLTFSGASSASNTITGNFFRFTDPSGATAMDLNVYGDFKDNVLFLDVPGDATHRHFLTWQAPGTMSGNVFIYNGLDPTPSACSGAAAAGSYVYSGNLGLPVGAIASIASGSWTGVRVIGLLGGASQAWTVEHNTFPSTDASGNNGVVTGDLFNPPAGFIASLRANLLYCDPVRAAGSLVWNGHTDANGATIVENVDVVPAGKADYNGCYNLVPSAKGVAGSSGAGTPYDLLLDYVPGVHDAHDDPRFVDPTRTLATWDASLGGAGAAAGAAARVAANPALIPTLASYLRAGFAPQAASYAGSYPGDPLQYKGAVAPAGAPAPPAGPSGLTAFLGHLTDPVTGAGGAFPVYSLANLGPIPVMAAMEHYDPTRCVYNARDAQVARGLTVSDWSVAKVCARTRMRDGYFLPNGGVIQYYHLYNTGVVRDYYEAGSLDSRDCALALDPVYRIALANLPYYLTQELSRECCFSVLALMECEWLGRDHSTITEELAALCLNHIDQWTRPAGQRYYAVWTRDFMVALTCEVLITYWERFRHNPDTTYVTTGPAPGWTQASIVAAIGGRVKTAADWMWANDWLPAGTAYNVDTGGNGTTTPTPPSSTWSHGSFKLGHEDTFGASPLQPVVGLAVSGTGTQTTFPGPNTLSTQTDYFKFAWVRFTSGAWAGYHARVGGYNGTTRTFTLDGYTNGEFIAPPAGAPAAGDLFNVYADSYGSPTQVPYAETILYTGGTGASPDLNHLIAPLFAYVYWRTKFDGAVDASYRANYETVFNGGMMCWTQPSAQKQWNQAVRWGFTGLDWEARGDAEWPAATTHTLTAPSPASGAANVPSDRIKVTLPAGTNAPNPVRMTFASSSGRGTFLPAAAILSTTRPYAMTRFVPDPLDAGSNVTISCTNDGGLTPTPGFSYAVTAAVPVATGYALTGPATATTGVPFAVTLATVPAGATPPVAWLRSGGGLLVVDPNDGYVGGSYTLDRYPPPATQTALPSQAWLSAERTTQRLDFTEPTAGTKSLTATNAAGAPAPPPLAVAVSAAVPAATSYTLTGPTSGSPGVPSGAFTVSLTPAGGGLAAAVTVRPGDGGGGGAFSPPAVTLSTASPSAAFTYTPASAAAVTVSCGSGGALADPPPLTFTAVRATTPGQPARFLPRRSASR